MLDHLKILNGETLDELFNFKMRREKQLLLDFWDIIRRHKNESPRSKVDFFFLEIEDLSKENKQLMGRLGPVIQHNGCCKE